MARSHPSVPAAVEAMASAKTSKKPKNVSKGNASRSRQSSGRPPVAEMVRTALEALKNRKGSSLYSIKRFIEGHYACNVAKLSPFIRNALKAGVENGVLIRTSGIGASGSFKLMSSQSGKKPSSAVGDKPKSKVRKDGATQKNGVSKQNGSTSLKVATKRPHTPMLPYAGKATSASVFIKN